MKGGRERKKEGGQKKDGEEREGKIKGGGGEERERMSGVHEMLATCVRNDPINS